MQWPEARSGVYRVQKACRVQKLRMGFPDRPQVVKNSSCTISRQEKRPSQGVEGMLARTSCIHSRSSPQWSRRGYSGPGNLYVWRTTCGS